MREMNESVHIISQVINKINLANYNFTKKKTNSFSNKFFNYFDSFSSFLIKPLKKNSLLSWYTSMEDLINHFKYYTEGLLVPQGFCYKGVESPKGEFGVLLTADGSGKPYRVKIKPASYHNLQFLTPLIQNHFFSDLVTLIGSQDIVLGEVDR
jgi:NADH:ubiquinone oxidoreductase subunit D